jgi:hypothetical protein
MLILMSRRNLITLISGLLLSTSMNCQVNFVSPLKIPLSLSANFAELRADHYHSGVDIKTQGVTGQEVVAADSGYVYLLLVSPTGFGKAIFVRHPSGYSTVYGHLDSYAPDIEEYVKTQQYRDKSFSVTIYPPQDRLPVHRGQLLGYSGNSGSSSGPHLHFEVRKSDSEKPVNPEKFNFPIEDNIKPVIERLVVYPSGRGTVINGRPGKLFLNVTGGNGHYEVQQDLAIHGTAGFGIISYDYMNDTQNRFGINSIELTIDSIPWFSYEVNEFSFYETRYINAHIDYEESIKRNIDIEKLFVLPNDRLSLYKTYMNNGLFDFSDGKIHKVSIVVKDGKGNSTKLSFSVNPGIELQDIFSAVNDSSIIVMPFGKENNFVSDGLKVNIPSGALYDTLYFTYRSTTGNSHLFSPVHHIHNRYIPVQKQITISVRPDSIPAGKSSKLLLVQIDEKGLITSAGGRFSDGYVTAALYSLGNYAVGIDTIPPVINANGLNANPDLSGKSEIRIRIKDDFSGIKAYEGLIDGRWALFEYDAKNDVIFYKFDLKRLTKGIKHTLNLTVSDNCDNRSTYTREFFW